MLAFDVIAAVLEITEMILFGRQKLHPAMYLISQILKMFLWTGDFAIVTHMVMKVPTPGLILALDGFYADRVRGERCHLVRIAFLFRPKILLFVFQYQNFLSRRMDLMSRRLKC